MTIAERMGCTTSIYDNPDITKKQNELQVQKSSIRLSSAHNNASAFPTSTLKRAKVSPSTNHNEVDTLAVNGQPAAIAGPDTGGRLSPALSDKTDRTETNRSIKRVAFNDEIDIDTRPTPGSSVELRRARRRRERNLRKRLLNQMGQAELMSEKLLADSERLSLTSSMSRTTSRTGSSFPYGRISIKDGDRDDATLVTACDFLSTPRDFQDDSNVNNEETNLDDTVHSVPSASNAVT